MLLLHYRPEAGRTCTCTTRSTVEVSPLYAIPLPLCGTTIKMFCFGGKGEAGNSPFGEETFSYIEVSELLRHPSYFYRVLLYKCFYKNLYQNATIQRKGETGKPGALGECSRRGERLRLDPSLCNADGFAPGRPRNPLGLGNPGLPEGLRYPPFSALVSPPTCLDPRRLPETHNPSSEGRTRAHIKREEDI